MKLAYLAFDKTGRQVAETIDAPSVQSAAETLRGRGLYVTKISGREQAEAPAPARRWRAGGRSGRLKNLAMFTRQLAVLVSSGTPLMQALSALERQGREKAWRSAIGDVRRRVEEGVPLSEAMASHGEYFDTVARSLVAVGESSGNLPAMLERLAVMTRKQLHVRNAVVGALIYPSLLLCVAVGVLTLLLLFVIPRFGELFKTLNVPLPPTTQALLWVGKMLQSYWWAALLGMVAAGTGIKLWLASPAGKKALDTLVLRLPQLGTIARSFATARMARMLGVLLDGAVPVLDALELTLNSTRNYHYVTLMGKARDAVSRGEPISSTFSQSNLISPTVCEAIHSGEQSGQVGALLLNMADFLDEENEVVLRSLTSILEPVILVVMGLLVGLVAMSMFLPMFDLTAMTQGGG